MAQQVTQQDEVELGVDELTDRQLAVITLKRIIAHNEWMEKFMTDLAPEFGDLTNAVQAMVSAFTGDNNTISSQLAQIADLNAQIATVTAQDNTDAASAAAALAQVASLNAQITTLTQTASDQAAAAEAAATTLNAALPASGTPTTPTTPTTPVTPPVTIPVTPVTPPVTAPTSTLPEYTYTGDPSAPIDAAWTKTSDTTPTGEALYTYSGDTAGQPATGDGLGGLWHLYTPPATS